VVLLAVIILMLVNQGEAPPNQVEFVFPGAGAKAWLTRLDGSGGERTSIPVAAGESTHTMEVEPGKYLLEVSLAHHDDFSKTITIAPGASKYPVELTPHPAMLSLTPGTPHVRAELLEVGGASEHPWSRALTLTGGEKVNLDKVPPGQVRIRTSRAGFRPEEVTVTLAAGERTRVDLPVLSEITGSLRLTCNAPGAEVVVTEAGEIFREEALRAKVPASGELVVNVRIGDGLWLEVLSPAHKPYRATDLAIREGRETVREVTLTLLPGQIVATGPEGTVVMVYAKDSSDALDLNTIGAQRSCTFRLDPGEYRIEMTHEGKTRKYPVSVEPGGTADVRFE
jgi:hypothetical protein